MKRSISDLEREVGFLTTRVSKSDMDDWEIAKGPDIFYCTIKVIRFFGATHLNEISTWVDASYAIHHDI